MTAASGSFTTSWGCGWLNESISHGHAQGASETLEALLEKAADYAEKPVEFDVNDSRFLAPGDIPERIVNWCHEHNVAPPERPVATVASIVWSLAVAFARAVDTAASLCGRQVSTIHLTGGGSLNRLLCQWVADISGREVHAGPVEATALGNILVQARSLGAVTGDVWTLRDLARKAVPPTVFSPRAQVVGHA